MTFRNQFSPRRPVQLSFLGVEDLARQELKSEADHIRLLAQFGVGRVPVRVDGEYGQVHDFDQDFTTAVQLVHEARRIQAVRPSDVPSEGRKASPSEARQLGVPEVAQGGSNPS